MINKSNKRKYMKVTMSAALLASVSVPAIVAEASSNTNFHDLAEGDLFYEEIQALASKGVIKGFPDGSVGAKNDITRAEAAQFIALSLGMDTKNVVNPGFTDVETEKWYYGCIAALTEENIIQGDGFTSNFRPTDTITRSEMASMIVKAFGFEQSKSAAEGFKDVPQSSWYAGYVGALKENGITNGKSATSFAPDDNVTRGEVAAFIYRSLANTNNTEKVVIESVSDSSLVIDGIAYDLSDEVKGLLNSSNEKVLKDAVISFETSDQEVTKITYLEVTTGGQDSKPVELSGNDAVVDGDVRINSDSVTVKDLTVKNNLIIEETVENNFHSDGIVVEGKTIISGSEATTANIANIASLTFVAVDTDAKDQTSITFKDATLNEVEINKPNALIEAKGSTKVTEIQVNANTVIQADEPVVVPKVTLSGNTDTVEINAAVTELDITSGKDLTVSGSANIERVTVSTDKKIRLDTTGEIKVINATQDGVKLTVGEHIKVETITVPEGSMVEDVLENYEDVKENIENVNEETSGDGEETPGDEENPGSEQDTKPSAESILSKYESSMGALGASAHSQVDSLVSQAMAELKSGDKTYRELYNKYMAKVNALESKIDSQFNSLLNGARSELEKHGYDPSLADSFESEFERQKEALRNSY